MCASACALLLACTASSLDQPVVSSSQARRGAERPSWCLCAAPYRLCNFTSVHSRLTSRRSRPFPRRRPSWPCPWAPPPSRPPNTCPQETGWPGWGRERESARSKSAGVDASSLWQALRPCALAAATRVRHAARAGVEGCCSSLGRSAGGAWCGECARAGRHARRGASAAQTRLHQWGT